MAAGDLQWSGCGLAGVCRPVCSWRQWYFEYQFFFHCHFRGEVFFLHILFILSLPITSRGGIQSRLGWRLYYLTTKGRGGSIVKIKKNLTLKACPLPYKLFPCPWRRNRAVPQTKLTPQSELDLVVIHLEEKHLHLLCWSYFLKYSDLTIFSTIIFCYFSVNSKSGMASSWRWWLVVRQGLTWWVGGSWNGKVIGIFTSVASARQDLIPFKSSRLKWAFFFCLVSNITFNTDAQTEAPLRWSKAREAPLTSSMLVEACLCWVERHLIFPLKMFYKW